MIDEHYYFNQLAVLASAGQLSSDEVVELEAHLDVCVACRRHLQELESAHRALFLFASHGLPSRALPAGMQDRFRRRALEAGVPLPSYVAPNTADPGALRPLRLAGLALACTLLASIGWRELTRTAEPAFSSHSQPDRLQASTPSPAPKPRAIKLSTRRRTARLLRVATANLAQASAPGRSYLPLEPVFSPAKIQTVAFGNELSGLGSVADYFPTTADLPARRFIAPASWFRDAHEQYAGQVFHYSTNVASLTFLDKPALQDVSFSTTLDSIRFR